MLFTSLPKRAKIMKPKEVLERAFTFLAHRKVPRTPSSVRRQWKACEHMDQQAIDVLSIVNNHPYKSSQILIGIRLGRMIHEVQELEPHVKLYAKWANELPWNVDDQTTDLAERVRKTNLLEGTKLIQDKLQAEISALHLESAENSDKLKSFRDAPGLLEDIISMLELLKDSCTCEGSFNEQKILESVSHVEDLVNRATSPYQHGNLSRSCLTVELSKRKIEGSEEAIDYIGVLPAADLILERCEVFPTLSHDLRQLTKEIVSDRIVRSLQTETVAYLQRCIESKLALALSRDLLTSKARARRP
ncbi:uncharacterized protein M437DRAFT_89275 [Aureobasidium melanogenum CBS 110374]|uniref:Uncharacterized protein n=1 Tax=Aureobasidium melanogenum (strain CBS 110374) TaxID=1043003 RepID=A0A074VBG6_AURM1|nr:uncharacterized protein M437DRAFT_89275 [Aureobasidium melanogenum CBS 110374]KEQ57663.1 hypothetical protein M437DRAFT_89275 [Aureobasidium melanogenum CBS 110374]